MPIYRTKSAEAGGVRPLCIYLLRHGETEGGACYRGKTDHALTATGREQMWRTVQLLPRCTEVITSPLARCAAFAGALAGRHSIPLRLDARLQEMDFGAWEGRTAAEIMETEPAALANFWHNPWRHGPPNAELLEVMQARVLAAWHELAASRVTSDRPHHILVVTHGGPIRVILADVLDIALEKLLHAEIAHAAVHRITVDATGVAQTTTLLP